MKNKNRFEGFVTKLFILCLITGFATVAAPLFSADAQTVTIPDANLRTALESALNKAAGADITEAELGGLRQLDARNSSITTLTGLEKATGLRSLNLKGNSVSDISPVVNLPRLRLLNVENNPLNYASLNTHIPAIETAMANRNNASVTYTARTPTTLTKVSGDSQTGELSATLANSFVVEVKDGANPAAVFAGVPVTFAVTAGGGTLSTTTVSTDATGRAETTLTLGATSVGAHTVDATVEGIADKVTFTATVSQVATTLVKISGDSQTADPGVALANAFVVEVRDQAGTAMSNVSVTFAVTAGGGTLSTTTATTGTNGQAETTLTLGTTVVGANTVEATVTGITEKITFTATANRKATTLVKVSGDSQTAGPGVALANAFVIEARDQSGAAMSDVSVTFNVTAGGGTLSAASATTNASGQAETTLTLGATVVGANTVEASAAGITEKLTFTATANQVATTLTKVSGDSQTGNPGAALTNAFVVEVQDQAGSAMSDVSVTFNVTAGGGTLSAASVTTNASGQAETTLTLGATVVGENTVEATVAGITEKLTFTATANQVATTLVKISGDTQTGDSGTALSNAFVVEVRDQAGTAMSGVSVAFSVTAGGGTLSAAAATTNASGQAETTLTLGATVVGENTVEATVAGITEKLTFTATANQVATTLVKISGDSQTGDSGAALSNAFVVEVRDQAGTAMSGVSVAFSVTAGGGTLSAASATTNASGQAETTLTLGATGTTNTVTASVTHAGTTLSVTFTAEINNSAPAFTSGTTFSVAENSTAVGTVNASDADSSDSVTGYTLGGVDSTEFSITDAGVLTFNTAPDYEDPGDALSSTPANAATNNEYIIVVTVTSGAGVRAQTAKQTFTITVTDVPPPGKPAVPTVTGADATPTALSVSWTAPTNTGPAITDYDVRYRKGTTGNFTDAGYTGTTTSTTLTELTAGTSYQVQVRAINAEGNSPWSDAGTGTTWNVPEQPKAPIVTTAAVGELNVVWTAPASDAPITGYKIEYQKASAAAWSAHAHAGTDTTTTLTSLASGIAYQVRVRAVNAVGNSTWSAASTGTTWDVPEQPAPPTVTVVEAASGAAGATGAAVSGAAASGATGAASEEVSKLTLTWTAPASDTPITSYEVAYKQSSDTAWINHPHTGTSTTVTLTGLADSTEYAVRVRAANAVGNSDWSPDSTFCRVLGDIVPICPVREPKVDDNKETSFRVCWKKPGAVSLPLNAYEVRLRSSSTPTWTPLTVTSFSVPIPFLSDPDPPVCITIEDLKPGTQYKVQVRPFKQILFLKVYGPWIESEGATLPTQPGTPDVKPVSGVTGAALEVSWVLRNNPDVTGFKVQYQKSQDNTWIDHAHEDDDSKGTTISNLQAGTKYDVRVRAMVKDLEGSWSAHGSGTPVDVPAKPVAPTVTTASHTNVNVTWTEPTNTWPDITDYDVQYREGTTGTFKDGPQTVTAKTATISGLKPNTSYQVRVRATNDEGTGPWSDAGTGKTDYQPEDVNKDGEVNVADLIAIGTHLGGTTNTAHEPDVNNDGTVNSADIQLVIKAALNNSNALTDIDGDDDVDVEDLVAFAATPVDVNGDTKTDDDDIKLIARLALNAAANRGAAPAPSQTHATLNAQNLQHLVHQALQRNRFDATYRRGVAALERILESLMIPEESALLHNYPNPFNPETWIPYQLASPAEVTLTLYDVTGRIVRTLNLGHQDAGMYRSKSRAAYWDGRNAQGESVASGVYFYTLVAGEFTATGKMLIRK